MEAADMEVGDIVVCALVQSCRKLVVGLRGALVLTFAIEFTPIALTTMEVSLIALVAT